MWGMGFFSVMSDEFGEGGWREGDGMVPRSPGFERD